MPETYNLDPDSIPIPVESFDEFEESITFFTTKTENGRKAWHYVPGDPIDEEHLLIYFGFADDGPLGQVHNSYVRVYLADGPEYETGSQEAEEAEELTDLRGNPLNPGPQETAQWEADVDALVLRGELPPME